MTQSPSESGSYSDFLAEIENHWQALPDKPEETPEGVLKALWLTASGTPVSVETATARDLPSLGPAEVLKLRGLIDRRKSGEPVAHLTGRQSFLGLELIAGPGALIPRKETEIVGRAALSRLESLVQERGDALVIDVCTGSGNLALAFAHHVPRSRVYAADLSHDAVALARNNLDFTGLEQRVEFRQGDLLTPFDSEEFWGKCDLLSCNPPYISTAKVQAMAKEISAFEPELAFNGGVFGISILTKFIRNAPRFLKANSWLFFEVGLGQGPALAKQLRGNTTFSQVETFADKAGDIRALAAKTSEEQ